MHLLLAATWAAVAQTDPDLDYALATYREVRETLASPDPLERRQAGSRLASRLEHARKGLRTLADGDGADAAILLGLLGDGSARGRLPLRSDDPVVRRNALEALARIRPAGRTKEALGLLGDPDLGVRLAAARALAAAEDRSVEKELGRRGGAIALLALELRSPGSRSSELVRWALEEKGDAWAAVLNAPRAIEELARTWDASEQSAQPRPRPQRTQATLRATALAERFDDEMPEDRRLVLGALLLQVRVWTLAELFRFVNGSSPSQRGTAIRLIRSRSPRTRTVAIPELLRVLESKGRLDAKDARELGEILASLTGGVSTVAESRTWWETNRKLVLDGDADRAIHTGVDFLLRIRREGGLKFCDCGNSDAAKPQHDEGATALALYTLLKCDVAPEDPALRPTIQRVLERDPSTIPWGTHTYTVSCTAMALSEFLIRGKGRKGCDSALQRKALHQLNLCVQALVDSQFVYRRGEYEHGGWTYGQGTGRRAQATMADWDQSNTQFAILALRAAANAGIKVPTRTWQRATLHYLATQEEDGGWSYNESERFGRSTQSMSAAGTGGILICRASATGKALGEVAKSEESVQRGLSWLERRFRLPPEGDYHGHGHGTLYNLYSLERVMMLAGLAKLGSKDWYAEGALWILRAQKEDGSWIDVADTCFALLFLKRAFVDVATGGGDR